MSFGEQEVADCLAEVTAMAATIRKMESILIGIGRAQSSLEAEFQGLKSYSHSAVLQKTVDALNQQGQQIAELRSFNAQLVDKVAAALDSQARKIDKATEASAAAEMRIALIGADSEGGEE